MDGNFNPAIDEAIANLRAQLGMTREPAIEQALFANYLSADVRKITAPPQPARFAEIAPGGKPVDSPTSTGTVIHVTGTADGAPPAASARAAVASPATTGAELYPVEPLALAISAGGRRSFGRGEPVDLQVRTNRNAYVYCYLQDEQRRVAQLYPNRWASNGYVTAGQTLSLPGDMRFQIVMNNRGVPETVACLATATDVSQQLPREVFGSDFEPLRVASLEQVRRGFLQTTNGQFTQEIFNVQPR